MIEQKRDASVVVCPVAAAEEPPNKKAKAEESVGAAASPDDDDEHTEDEDAAERAVGITRFVSPDGPRLAGVLKSRYADFVVHEVSTTGEIIQLRSIALPSPSSSSSTTSSSTTTAVSATVSTVGSSPEQQLAELVGEEQTRKFAEFAADETSQKFVFEAEEDRAKRTAVHALIKRHYPAFDTSTDAKRIVANRGKREVRRQGWPKGRPKHLQFTLFKENMDTGGAVQMISRRLGIWPDSIGMAGNKDKRAITTQRLTALRVDADRIAALNGRIGTAIIGDCSYVEDPLKLGDLYGNRFELAVRDIGNVSEAVVASSVAALQEKGFMNYFGLQRFGTGTVRTHEIGIALLRHDWEVAAKLIMHPHSRSSAEAVSARELFLKGDLQGCADTLPRGFHIEAALVNGLLKHGPTAFKEAIEGLPRTTQLLYLHAYQSFVWNHMASKRLELFGAVPVAGDLVLTAGEDTVHVLTEDDVRSGKHSIFDVVLPLPGAKSVYPSNQIGAEFDQALALDGLSRKAIVEQPTGLLLLPGGYRTVIAKPENVEWRLTTYTDPTLPLITTDAERVRGMAPTPSTTTAVSATGEVKRALLIAFTLRSSCYATMCYRELLKQHTSAQFQTALEHRTTAPFQ